MKNKFIRLFAVAAAMNISLVGGLSSYMQVYATDQIIDISGSDADDSSSLGSSDATDQSDETLIQDDTVIAESSDGNADNSSQDSAELDVSDEDSADTGNSSQDSAELGASNEDSADTRDSSDLSQNADDADDLDQNDTDSDLEADNSTDGDTSDALEDNAQDTANAGSTEETDNSSESDNASEGTYVEVEVGEKYVLVITCPSAEYLYDGTPKTVSGYTLSGRKMNSDSMILDSPLDASQNINISDLNFEVSGFDVSVTATDAGSYDVTISGTPVIKDANGNDVSSKFELEINTGTLTINKREVKLRSESDSKTYDGKALKCHDVRVTGDGFADGEGASYEFTGEQTEVGKSYNYFSYTLNSGTKAANYDITVVPGTLKVKKAESSNDSNNSNDSNDSNNTSDTTTTDNSSSDSTTSSSDATTTDSSVADSSTTASSDTAATELNKSNNSAVLGASREETNLKTDNQETYNNVLGARRGATGDENKAFWNMIVLLMALITTAGAICSKRLKS